MKGYSNICMLFLVIITHNCYSQPDDCSNISSHSARLANANFLFTPSQLGESEINIQRVLEHILCIAKIPTTGYIIRTYPNIEASAIQCNNVKYVLYSTDYLIPPGKKNPYIIYGILAHEIAHHVKGDCWLSADRQNLDAELKADTYAGEILGRIHAPLTQALESLDGVCTDHCNTHPPKNARIAALTNGWNNGAKNKISNTILPIIINCSSTIESPYKIQFRVTKNRVYEKSIKLELGPLDQELRQNISKVSYYLHPTFEAPVRIQYNALENFALDITIAGDFEVRCTVFTKDGNEYLTTVNTNLFSGMSYKPPIKW